MNELKQAKISIHLDELKELIKAAESKVKDDQNGYLDLVMIKKAKYHAQSDVIEVFAQSSWSECDSKYIYTNK
jgi:hypothetical protein